MTSRPTNDVDAMPEAMPDFVRMIQRDVAALDPDDPDSPQELMAVAQVIVWVMVGGPDDN